MLGAMVAAVVGQEPDLELRCTLHPRSKGHALALGQAADVQWLELDAATCHESDLSAALAGASYAINCIGVIKPYIHDDNAAEVERAIEVNARFPHRLARAAQETGCFVLQIATDCVYSGAKGLYREPDVHDALDVYGKTKSLGEVPSPVVAHLRCSIIGPEPKAHVSLLDWFLGQTRGASVNGFTNHQWNGVTTYHYGRLCAGILRQRLTPAGLQHVVPSGTISKYDLLKAFARAYARPDIVVTATEAKTVIDRTLSTIRPEGNLDLWNAAGYAVPPTVVEMVDEMAQRAPQLQARQPR
jgi:dTDP-4-dehydrorhamnose reductase